MLRLVAFMKYMEEYDIHALFRNLAKEFRKKNFLLRLGYLIKSRIILDQIYLLSYKSSPWQVLWFSFIFFY